MIENLNSYYIFYIVAKCGNISKAAAQLYISQPAISKSIKKLEDELNTELFLRNSRGVVLTEEGQMLYEYAERAFDNLGKGRENLRKYGELGLGHIRIGVSTSLCKHILLAYLKDFIKDNPNVKFSIDCHSTLNTIRLLKNGDIDIGLICDTGLPKGMVYSPTREIHDIFVASEDYIAGFQDGKSTDYEYAPAVPFAGNVSGLFRNYVVRLESENGKSRRHTEISTKELLEKSNLMVLEEANVTRTHVDNYLRSEGITCSQILEINNMDLLIDFAAIGMGVASVVREFAETQLDSGEICELPLDVPIPPRTVGFAYDGGRGRSAAVRKFLEFVGV